jgi:hypothetical protein
MRIDFEHFVCFNDFLLVFLRWLVSRLVWLVGFIPTKF